MTTFFSRFKTLPTAFELREIAGKLPRLTTLPFWSLPTDSFERKYLGTVYDILAAGRAKASRPGQYTLMKDDVQFSVDISDGYIPLVTTRYVPYNSFVVETLWFLSGATNIKFLKEHNVSIWDDWVQPGTEVFAPAEKYTAQEVLNYVRLKHPLDYRKWNKHKSLTGIGRPVMADIEAFFKVENAVIDLVAIPRVRLVDGSIGNGAYGAQWRKWKDLRAMTTTAAKKLTDLGRHFMVGTGRFNASQGTSDLVAGEFDQIADVIKMLRTSPDSRRIIVSAWNPVQVPEAVLPPCHCFFQFISTVNEETMERELTLKLTQRSADFLIGSCFNIGQYALLAHMVAHVTGHKATKLVYSPADCHIYEDQLPFVIEQLQREPKPEVRCKVTLDPKVTELHGFGLGNMKFEGYDKDSVHPNIPYPVAV